MFLSVFIFSSPETVLKETVENSKMNSRELSRHLWSDTIQVASEQRKDAGRWWPEYLREEKNKNEDKDE